MSDGACLSALGSREPSPTVSALTGFDPSRFVRQTKFGDEGDCLRAAVASITGVALDDVVDVLDGSEPEEVWFDRIEQWGQDRGWLIEVRSPGHPPEGLSLASGPTCRASQTHAIVALNGKAWWDPHPSDAYISSVNYYLAFQRDSDRSPEGGDA